MYSLHHTPHYQLVTLFDAQDILPVPHYETALLVVSEHTAVPIDEILSVSQEERPCYGRHMLFFTLNRLLGLSPTRIEKDLHWSRKAITEGVKNIEDWISIPLPHVKLDHIAISNSIQQYLNK